MKLKYIIMCILTMISIVMKAQGTQYYEVSQTPATTVEAGKMYVLRNREYPALCLEYDLTTKSLAYGSASSLLGAMRPMCNYFITAGSDGFSVDCTLKNVNDDFDSPGIGEVGGGTVLSKGQRVANSEPNYFTVKVTSGELAMVSLDEYGSPRILSVNATNPAPSAQWIAYLVSKHTNHTYEPSGSDVHVCSACQHVEYHSWGSDGKCTVCGYECQHPDYSEGHCVNCGMACQHQWENLNGIYSQCSICHSTARNAASVTIDGTTSYYISAEDAVAKAAEGTAEKPAAIKMLNDYDRAAGDYTVNVTSGVMTLDLNGYTLSHAFYSGATIQMDGGDLTIEDSSEAQTGKVANSGYAIRYISGSLTINGGTFCSNDGSSSNTSGCQALYAYNATHPYTPGSIKLRGGVFMQNSTYPSITVWEKEEWDIIDLDGYCFVDKETDKFVPVPTNVNNLQKSVVVKPSDNYAPFEVTIDGVSKKYISAEAAFAKAAEGTAEKPAAIKMLNNYDRAARDYTVNVTSGVMTLDLNGYTLSHGFYGGATIQMDGGDLTIEDSSEAQTGKVANSAYAIKYVSGSLTINGGTFCSNDGSVPSMTWGSQALYAFNATMPYTPGSIKLRGGVFMDNDGSSSILVPYNGSAGWDLIDMDGYCFVDKETGKLASATTANPNLMQSVVVKPADNYYVASVTIDDNTYKYFFAEDAFAKAAEGTTEKPAAIKMLDDCVKNSDQYYIKVMSGVMTLDLNGHTLSHGYVGESTIHIEGGDLTIEDSSEAQTGKVANSHYAINYVSGSLTINGGTFCADDCWPRSDWNSTGEYAISAMNAEQPYRPGSIKLRGGVFKMMEDWYSSIQTLSLNGKSCWDIFDMEGYCFVDTESDEAVIMHSDNNEIWASVTVKPADAYYAVTVTIDGNTYKYVSAEEAFAKAAEGTAEKPAAIKLLKDCVKTTGQYFINVTSGVMTLDLNGYTLSHGFIGESTIHVEGGDLTIEDSSEAQTGKVANCSYAIYYVSGTLTINGGTFCSNDGSVPSNTSGSFALHAGSAAQPYTPGSIKLRGGVFMMNDDNASILVPYNDNDEPCWDIIDIDGYCFVDKETDKFVPLPMNNSNLMKSVVVKPLDDYAPFEVTIDGNTTKYFSAEDAFAKAAEGTAEKPATIKMLQDFNLEGGNSYVAKVESGVMTLDLNGFTLGHGYFWRETIHMEGGDLTIEDSSEAQTGKVANASYPIYYVSGSLTINGGTFISNDGLSQQYPGSGEYALYASAATRPYTPGSIKLRDGVFMMNHDYASIVVPYNHEPCWDIIDLDGYYLEDVETGERVELPKDNSNLYVSVAVKKRQTPTIYIADQKIALNEESIAAFNREHTDVQLSLGEELVNVSLNGFKYEGAPEQSGVIELMDENVELHLIIKGENSIKLTGVTGKERLAAVMANELVISSDGTLDIDIDETCSAGQVAGIMADEGVMTYGRGLENFVDADIQGSADISEFTGTVSINNNASGSLSAGIISKASMLFSGKFNVQTTSSSSIGIYSLGLLLSDVDMNVNSSGHAFAAMQLVTLEAELTLQGTAGVCTQAVPGMPVMAMAMMRFDNYEGLNYDVKAGTSAENAQKMEFVQSEDDPSQYMAIIPDGITYLHANHSIQLTEDSEVEVKNVNGNYITAQDIVIEDGKDFKVFVPFDAPRVTFKRNVKKDGKKYSFVVPFDIPAEQAAELGKFYLYDHHDDSKVYFVEATDGVSANRAYFFAPAKDIESITVEDVTISAAQIFEDSFHESYSGLYGTYSTADIPEGAYGYDVDGTFVKAGTGNKLAPFRAILWLTDEIAFEAKQLIPVFGDEDDIATGISTVATDRPSAIYNISGQRVSAPARTGLYIQNGRKVVKK